MGDTTPDDHEPTSDHEVMDANPQNHTSPDVIMSRQLN